MNTSERTARIEVEMLREFKRTNIEDTPVNRVLFLTGMLDSWKYDATVSAEKSKWMIALEILIAKSKKDADL